MGKRKPRKKTSQASPECDWDKFIENKYINPLYQISLSVEGYEKSLEAFCEEKMQWYGEILKEVKKSFASPDIQLLPKTPRVPRTRRAKAAADIPLENTPNKLCSSTILSSGQTLPPALTPAQKTPAVITSSPARLSSSKTVPPTLTPPQKIPAVVTSLPSPSQTPAQTQKRPRVSDDDSSPEVIFCGQAPKRVPPPLATPEPSMSVRRSARIANKTPTTAPRSLHRSTQRSSRRSSAAQRRPSFRGSTARRSSLLAASHAKEKASNWLRQQRLQLAASSFTPQHFRFSPLKKPLEEESKSDPAMLKSHKPVITPKSSSVSKILQKKVPNSQSFLSQLKKREPSFRITTPTHSAKSFIQRISSKPVPPKKLDELKSKKQAQRQVAVEMRLQKEKELKQREIDEKKRLREEKAVKVAQRRKEREMERQKKQDLQEQEKHRREEQLQRKREHEEAERSRRLLEAKRAEDERRARAEQEKLREQQLLRQLEEKRKQEEVELRRQREEAEKLEKAAREKKELNLLKERERQKQIEIEQQKERELKRVRAQAVLESKQSEEEQKTRALIDKHNKLVAMQAVSSANQHSVFKNATPSIYSSSTTPRPAPLHPASLHPASLRAASPRAHELAPRRSPPQPLVSVPAKPSSPRLVAKATYGVSQTLKRPGPGTPQPKQTVRQPLCSVREDTPREVASAVPAKLNRTLTKDSDSAASSDSYELTPVRQKVVNPSTDNNYNINDLNSDDSTDDENEPRKKVPAWARGNLLKAALVQQCYHPPELDILFGGYIPPNLNQMFTKIKPRFNKRTSSGVWNTPPHLVGKKV